MSNFILSVQRSTSDSSHLHLVSSISMESLHCICAACRASKPRYLHRNVGASDRQCAPVGHSYSPLGAAKIKRSAIIYTCQRTIAHQPNTQYHTSRCGPSPPGSGCGFRALPSQWPLIHRLVRDGSVAGAVCFNV